MEHNYIESEEEREEGHINTRSFDCECDPIKDEDCNCNSQLGCDLGIDVAG